MKRKLTMVYWKGDHFWLGKLLEHPEIMTQGETLEPRLEFRHYAVARSAWDQAAKGF